MDRLASLVPRPSLKRERPGVRDYHLAASSVDVLVVNWEIEYAKQCHIISQIWLSHTILSMA